MRRANTHRPRIMMLLLCSVILNVYLARACYVDISITTDNFAGFLNFTYDEYTEFFSMLLPDHPATICRLNYPFSFDTQQISIFTCSDLKITDYGDYFKCEVTQQTYFQCNRMKRNIICDNDNPWTEFHTRNSSATIPSVRVCLSSNIQRIAISYKEKDLNTVCPRPTHADSGIPSDVSSAGALGITEIASSRPTTTSHVVEINQILSSQTTLIVGVCVGIGVLILVIIVIVIVCLRKRLLISKKNRMDLNSVKKAAAYDNPIMTPYGKSTTQFTPAKSYNNEKTNLKTNTQVVLQERNETARKLATEFSRKREENGVKMQLAPKHIEPKTFGKLDNSSNNFVNKAFLNLENDGISVNVAGPAYNQVAIKSSDYETVGSNYFYLKPSDSERGRSTCV